MELSPQPSAFAVPESVASLTVLVISDEEPVRELIRAQAEALGLRVKLAPGASQALAAFEQQSPDLAVADLATPSLGGIEFIRRVHARFPDTPLIALTEFDAAESGSQALGVGAADFAARPFEDADLRAKLQLLARTVALGRENRVLREQLSVREGFRGLVGVSAKMRLVYQLVEKASRSLSPVLIQGDTGTGKELVARSIHFLGSRKSGPFVPVDCTALVPTLVESELFGFVKGAFTGAALSKRGLIEAASGGTLFLDEIGEFPLEMQPKLLRALQEKQVRPVGSTAAADVDIRVVAATNRNLQEESDRGRFRQDLYFRLNVIPIRLPALRERKGDIPLLVSHFLERQSSPDRPTPAVADDAMARLIAYEWPGNVRELENAIARALALNSGPVIRLSDLPTNLQVGAPARLPLEEEVLRLGELERRAIYRALHKSGGDKLAAARLLGIGKTTLYRKLKQYESQ